MRNESNKKMLIILGVLSLIIAFLLNAANWFQATWDRIDFATVVYQLKTPLQGTNREVIVDFCKTVFPDTIISVILVMCSYYVVSTIFSRIFIEFTLKIFSIERIIYFGKNFINKAKVIFIVCFMFYSGNALYGKVKELGIDKYVADLFDKSTIFEEYYVSPDDVEISFPKEKRNMICIYLESMETTYASYEEGGGKEHNYIPELTSLAKEYVNISHTEGLGGAYPCALTGWTMAALMGSTSGIPYKIPGDKNDGSLYAEMLPGVLTLGDILASVGYKNYFMCGSDAQFGGRDIYFKSHGNYEILDYYYAYNNQLVSENIFWGYDDQKLFEIAKKELGKIANSGENFNFTMLTVDTHQPSGYVCELCENQYDEQYANVIACSSKQTYEFVCWIQEQEWYENTTIVLLGDHNSMVADFWNDIGDYDRRTYNCFINLPDKTDISNIKNREFSTLDLFPTIISAIGGEIEGERLGLGVNCFSVESTLTEQLGRERLDEELFKYSDYYNKYFINEETR